MHVASLIGMTSAWDLLSHKLLGWGRAFVLALPNFLLAIGVVVAFWFLARGAKNVAMKLLRRVSQSEQVTFLLGQAVYVAVLASGTFIALGILGLQKTVATLLAGAGILGLALGFAFQDIASNFLAGIYLSVRRPFRRGHFIKTGDWTGVVQEVNLRWTEILTPEGQVVMIPNKQVFENPILNYSLKGIRRVDVKVGVSYDDDLLKARQVAGDAVAALPGRVEDRPVEVFFEDLADSSINAVVRFWIPFRLQKDYVAARSEAIIAIKTAFDEAGITIPYPIQTIDLLPREAGPKPVPSPSGPDEPEA